MFSRSILFALFLFVGFSGFSQIEGPATYKVQYKAKMAIDSTQRENPTVENFTLFTGDSVSYFASEGTIYLDSMMTAFRKKAQSGNIRASVSGMREEFKNMPRTKFGTQVYKNLKKKEIWVLANISRDRFIYPEKAIPLNWKIKKETKVINGHVAQSATVNFGGRLWTAWFSPEIPLQDGPYVFSGLPGLVLELYDAQDDYHFSIISLKKLNNPHAIAITQERLKRISKPKFVKAYKNFLANPLNSLGANIIKVLDRPGFKVPDPETGDMISGKELKQRIKKQAQEQNNYIERF